MPAGELGGIAGNGPAGGPVARIPTLTHFDHPLTLHPSEFDRGAVGRAALKAGVMGGVVAAVSPLLGVLLAGTFAVFFYRREKGFAPPIGVGSRAGGAAGVISFAINYLIFVIGVFAWHRQQEYTEQMVKLWQKLGVNLSDPDVQNTIHILFTPAGIALTFFVGMIFAVALAAAGGALTALFLRRRPRG